MANYAQWRTHADTGIVRRVTWVCGDQRILVEDVVDTIRRLLAPTDNNRATFHAGDTPDVTIWDAAFQHPLVHGDPRLIVIRDADKITNWKPFTTWITLIRRLPTTHLLFVSAAHDLPRPDGSLPAHLDAMKSPRGHIIRCTQPNTADAADHLRSIVSMSGDTARHLLARAGGNLTTAIWTCRKLALFDITAGKTTIDALVDPAPDDDFTDALLADRKDHARLAIPDLEPTDLPKIFGLLDSRLDLMHTLWRAAIAGQTPREITGVPAFLIHTYNRYAHAYDTTRCERNRQLIAALDDVVRGGAHDGVPDALVALW